MRRRTSLMLVTLLAVLPRPELAAVTPVGWHTDFNKAAAVAQQRHQLVMIEFWATWCAACKNMDQTVFASEAVSTAMSKVVPVRVDIDKKPDLARKYGVFGTPTFVFADRYGNELLRVSGALTTSAMVQLMNELPGDVAHLNRLADALALNKHDVVALIGMADALRAAHLYRASNDYYRRALDRTQRDKEKRRELLAALAANHLELKEGKEAAAAFKRHLLEFSGSPEEPEIMLGLARAWLLLGKRDEAKQLLVELTTRHKTAPPYADAMRLLRMLAS